MVRTLPSAALRLIDQTTSLSRRRRWSVTYLGRTFAQGVEDERVSPTGRAQAGDEAEDQVLDGAPVVEQALVRFVVHGVSVDGDAVPAVAGGTGDRVLKQRRCHSLTATTARRRRRFAWRRGVLAVVDAPGPAGPLTRRAVCSVPGAVGAGTVPSLPPTTARGRPRLHWRRGALAVVDARPARWEGLLAGRGLLLAVGGVAFEAAVGGLVDAGGGLNHRLPDPGPQEPVDGFQPALQLMPNYATCATLLRSDSIVVTKLVACSQHLLAAPTSSAPTTRIRMAGG